MLCFASLLLYGRDREEVDFEVVFISRSRKNLCSVLRAMQGARTIHQTDEEAGCQDEKIITQVPKPSGCCEEAFPISMAVHIYQKNLII